MFLAQYDGPAGAEAGVPAGLLLIVLVITVFYIACMWKIFAKAGQPGWWSIIPIWNVIALVMISGRPIWWFLLTLIPGIGFIFWIPILISLAERFGKGVGFAIGLFFLSFIFIPILAFDDSEYEPA